MIIRRSYVIASWKTWDHELNAFTLEFHERFQIYPNVTLANQHTLARMDMAANTDNVRGPNGEEPDEAEYAPLDAFLTADYQLMFAIDTDLADLAVSLIHDSDPDDGGEPIPDEDTPVPAVATGTE